MRDRQVTCDFGDVAGTDPMNQTIQPTKPTSQPKPSQPKPSQQPNATDPTQPTQPNDQANNETNYPPDTHMQVPLAGHLPEPAHAERLTPIADTRPFLPPTTPLTVVEQFALAASAALAAAVLFAAVSMDVGASGPHTSVSECEDVWADGQWSAELLDDVDHETFVDLCVSGPGN